MKKYSVLLAIAVALSSTSIAQDKTSDEKEVNNKKVNVPAAVMQSFTKKYPGTSAKWEKEDGKYEAGFKQQEREMSALFEANGTMIESEMDIKPGELPTTATAYIKEHRKNAAIKGASKITKANGEINYEAEVNGTDLIFDETGKFMREVKD